MVILTTVKASSSVAETLCPTSASGVRAIPTCFPLAFFLSLGVFPWLRAAELVRVGVGVMVLRFCLDLCSSMGGCFYLTSFFLQIIKCPLFIKGCFTDIIVQHPIDDLIPNECVLHSTVPVALKTAVVCFVFDTVDKGIKRLQGLLSEFSELIVSERYVLRRFVTCLHLHHELVEGDPCPLSERGLILEVTLKVSA